MYAAGGTSRIELFRWNVVRDRHAGASCRCLRSSARLLAAPPVPAMLFVSSTAAATIGAARMPAPQFGPATLFDWAGVAFFPVAQLGPAGLYV